MPVAEIWFGGIRYLKDTSHGAHSPAVRRQEGAAGRGAQGKVLADGIWGRVRVGRTLAECGGMGSGWGRPLGTLCLAPLTHDCLGAGGPCHGPQERCRSQNQHWRQGHRAGLGHRAHRPKATDHSVNVLGRGIPDT